MKGLAGRLAPLRPGAPEGQQGLYHLSLRESIDHTLTLLELPGAPADSGKGSSRNKSTFDGRMAVLSYGFGYS